MVRKTHLNEKRKKFNHLPIFIPVQMNTCKNAYHPDWANQTENYLLNHKRFYQWGQLCSANLWITHGNRYVKCVVNDFSYSYCFASSAGLIYLPTNHSVSYELQKFSHNIRNRHSSNPSIYKLIDIIFIVSTLINSHFRYRLCDCHLTNMNPFEILPKCDIENVKWII